MMLIARRCLFFIALQFVVITRYYVSLRLARKKQQRTLNTAQLGTLGLKYFIKGDNLAYERFSSRP